MKKLFFVFGFVFGLSTMANETLIGREALEKEIRDQEQTTKPVQDFRQFGHGVYKLISGGSDCPKYLTLSLTDTDLEISLRIGTKKKPAGFCFTNEKCHSWFKTAPKNYETPLEYKSYIIRGDGSASVSFKKTTFGHEPEWNSIFGTTQITKDKIIIDSESFPGDSFKMSDKFHIKKNGSNRLDLLEAGDFQEDKESKKIFGPTRCTMEKMAPSKTQKLTYFDGIHEEFADDASTAGKPKQH